MLWTTSSGSNTDPFFLWKDNGPIAVSCGTSSVGLNWHHESIADDLGSAELDGKTLTDFSGESGFIPASSVEAQFLPTVDLAPLFDSCSRFGFV